MLIAGAPSILEAMESGVELEKIYLQNDVHHSLLKSKAFDLQIPVHKVPAEKLRGFNMEDHGGCIAIKSKIHYQNLQNVISWLVERGEIPLILLLDGITDIRNIGGIARAAYCTGVHALVIPEKGVGSLNEDAIATSAGALEQIAVCRVRNIQGAIEELQLNGLKVYVSEMTSERNIFEINFTEPCGIIMGSEDKGVQKEMYKLSDGSFKIPMKNNFESLNVSVAAGIILYEAMKQRMT